MPPAIFWEMTTEMIVQQHVGALMALWLLWFGAILSLSLQGR